MIYKAYLKQHGEGCDYTIGCGLRVIDIDAKDMIDAECIVEQEIQENYVGDRSLKSCVIFEIIGVKEVDLNSLYDEIAQEKKQDEKEEADRRELEEYRKLKAKFGNIDAIVKSIQ